MSLHAETSMNCKCGRAGRYVQPPITEFSIYTCGKRGCDYEVPPERHNKPNPSEDMLVCLSNLHDLVRVSVNHHTANINEIERLFTSLKKMIQQNKL